MALSMRQLDTDSARCGDDVITLSAGAKPGISGSYGRIPGVRRVSDGQQGCHG